MSTPAPDRWIQRPRPAPGARLRLFCIPHAGGGASAYRGWADALPPEVEVCPVQLPGRENRMAEPAIDRLEPLVEALAEAVGRWSDLPFAVFGHSNGALIAFELARHLRAREARQMAHLFASGRRAPHLPQRTPFLHALPDDAFVREVRALGGTPEEVLAHPELLRLLIPLLRADIALNETYAFRDEPPLDLPLTAYGGIADEKAHRDELEGWARHTARAFVLRLFPGDHFFLHGPARDAVLRALAQDLLRLIPPR